MNFEDYEKVMQLTRTIASPTCFDEEECYAYFTILKLLKPNSVIVEIGLQYGRSSSIALQVASRNGCSYYGVDPFIDPPEAEKAWHEMATKAGRQFSTVRKCLSKDFAVPRPIDALLIDGEHAYANVKEDCEHLVPFVKVGGHAMVHDYRRPSLPGVEQAVDEYFNAHVDEWHHVGTYGTLGVWRRYK